MGTAMNDSHDAASRFVRIVANLQAVVTVSGRKNNRAVEENLLGEPWGLNPETLSTLERRMRSGHAQDEAASPASAGAVSS